MVEKNQALLSLAAGIEASLHVMPMIIKIIHNHIPEKHRKVNVVATLLVMVAKKVLEAEGWPEEKQVAFVAAAAKLITSQPDVKKDGVVIVASLPPNEQN